MYETQLHVWASVICADFKVTRTCRIKSVNYCRIRSILSNTWSWEVEPGMRPLIRNQIAIHPGDKPTMETLTTCCWNGKFPVRVKPHNYDKNKEWVTEIGGRPTTFDNTQRQEPYNRTIDNEFKSYFVERSIAPLRSISVTWYPVLQVSMQCPSLKENVQCRRRT